jgi:uncharacterized protein YjbI with pentapeptide repeats
MDSMMRRLGYLIATAFGAVVGMILRLGYAIATAFRADKTLRVATALGLAVAVALTYGIWFDWEWKAMIGWKALENYINPARDDTTGKKDAVQVYAVIVAGVIASITAAVGLANLRLTRRNLEQQRDLEAQRAQGTALQAYYEQIGKLIADKDLLNTQRKEIRELARGQTLSVLQEVDGKGKASLLTFLHGAGLIGTQTPAVELTGANLRKADLQGANLQGVNLQGASLEEADLRGANLREANLREANLRGANLLGIYLRRDYLEEADIEGADLRGAYLRDAQVSHYQLSQTAFLQGATMPDGAEHT